MILADEGRFDGPTPPLTGAEALDLADLAAIASEVLGRRLRRQTLADEDLRVKMAERGAPDRATTMMLGLYIASRDGEFAAVDPILERLLGRRLTRMRDLIAHQREVALARDWNRSKEDAAWSRLWRMTARSPAGSRVDRQRFPRDDAAVAEWMVVVVQDREVIERLGRRAEPAKGQGREHAQLSNAHCRPLRSPGRNPISTWSMKAMDWRSNEARRGPLAAGRNDG